MADKAVVPRTQRGWFIVYWIAVGINLLLFLAQHPNQVFSKKYLFEMIWHLDALGELATVTVHVNRLRDKLNQR